MVFFIIFPLQAVCQETEKEIGDLGRLWIWKATATTYCTHPKTMAEFGENS
jgi:hypothetical protein